MAVVFEFPIPPAAPFAAANAAAPQSPRHLLPPVAAAHHVATLQC